MALARNSGTGELEPGWIWPDFYLQFARWLVLFSWKIADCYDMGINWIVTVWGIRKPEDIHCILYLCLSWIEAAMLKNLFRKRVARSMLYYSGSCSCLPSWMAPESRVFVSKVSILLVLHPSNGSFWIITRSSHIHTYDTYRMGLVAYRGRSEWKPYNRMLVLKIVVFSLIVEEKSFFIYSLLECADSRSLDSNTPANIPTF